MKKVLFTTTALVACAGMAAAEVNVSGSGRLGLVYATALAAAASAASALDAIDGTAAVGSSVRSEKRMTINIDGSGETDGGLSFGGRIRLRSDEVASSAIAGANIWVGNDTWRVTTGNSSGALNWRMNYFAGSVGLTGLGYRNVSFNIGASNWGIGSYSSRGNGDGVIRLDFNVGDFGVSLSTDNTEADVSNAVEDAIAVSYNFGDWTVAAGYADDAVAAASGAVVGGSITSVSASGSVGDFGVDLAYSDRELVGSKAVLSGSYDFGGTSVAAFVARTNEAAVGSAGIGATGSKTEYGLGFTHSLGGATLAGGIARNYAKQTQADLGIRFSF